uniref:acid phosphatase n=1 Tax=Timema monikensis TaxID=170555 RepID=A0A7R9HU28_9NEOP|nr:unnamed protein product [Timema monikensis]
MLIPLNLSVSGTSIDKREPAFTMNIPIFKYTLIVGAGPLLKAISSHMTSKMAGSLTPDRKLFLYSGHDSTITSLLQGLGFPRKFVVEYGAAIFFELYSTSDGLGTVKVLFLRNAELRDPQPIKPDQLLEQFLSWIEPVIPTDWDRDLTYPGYHIRLLLDFQSNCLITSHFLKNNLTTGGGLGMGCEITTCSFVTAPLTSHSQPVPDRRKELFLFVTDPRIKYAL